MSRAYTIDHKALAQFLLREPFKELGNQSLFISRSHLRSFCDRGGIDKATVDRMLSGANTPHPSTLQEIRNALIKRVQAANLGKDFEDRISARFAEITSRWIEAAPRQVRRAAPSPLMSQEVAAAKELLGSTVLPSQYVGVLSRPEAARAALEYLDHKTAGGVPVMILEESARANRAGLRLALLTLGRKQGPAALAEFKR